MTTSKKIVDELKAEILAADLKIKAQPIGTVIEAGDGVARITGLPDAKSAELIEIETEKGKVAALILNLETDTIGAIILGRHEQVRAGDQVHLTGKITEIPAGRDFIGRVINPLGEPIDGRGPIKSTTSQPIERIAPGVITRQPVDTPLQTGVKAIDSMIPIGRGQRELIIGDRATGKTALAIDTIINQKPIRQAQGEGKKCTCIYVAIGQKESKVAKIVDQLTKEGAMTHTIVVVASASDPAPLNFIAPYSGCAIGEYFLERGEDALIVYDDLSKHAWAYREVSLLLRRPPGREAYPGDIFYLHSRLLERAARLNAKNGGGSLTALPIIETQAGDISAYIPTNVISITDGQIYLESDLFYQGIRPALNIGLSVSRVGGKAQIKAMKKVAGKLRLDAAQYRELAAFAQFGSDLDKATRDQLERGRRVTEILKQPQYQPMPVEEQVVILYAVTNSYLDRVPVEEIRDTEDKILTNFRSSHKDILKTISEKGDLPDELEKKLQAALEKIVPKPAEEPNNKERITNNE